MKCMLWMIAWKGVVSVCLVSMSVSECLMLKCLQSQNILKMTLKSPRFDSFGANLAQFVAIPDIPGLTPATIVCVFSHSNTFLFIIILSICAFHMPHTPQTADTHIMWHLCHQQTELSYLVCSTRPYAWNLCLDLVLFYCFTVNVCHLVKVKNLMIFLKISYKTS